LNKERTATMNKIRFGSNNTFNLSSSHNDIWGTNKLDTKSNKVSNHSIFNKSAYEKPVFVNSTFTPVTVSKPAFSQTLNFPKSNINPFQKQSVKPTPQTFSTKFHPMIFEDKDDKIRIGRNMNNHKYRQVKIMQFSNQIEKLNPKLKISPTELRLGYMANNFDQYKNGNLGYNRDSLVNVESTQQTDFNTNIFMKNDFDENQISKQPFTTQPFKSQLFNFSQQESKRPGLNLFTDFKTKDSGENAYTKQSFNTQPSQPQPFNFSHQEPKNRGFKFTDFKTTDADKKLYTKQPFNIHVQPSKPQPFNFSQQEPKKPFAFMLNTNPSNLSSSKVDTKGEFKFHWPKPEENTTDTKTSTIDWSKSKENSRSQKPLAFNNCFRQLKQNYPDLKFTNSKAVDTKPPEEKSPDSLILQHTKDKIIKHMELRNSIQDNLQNDPFAIISKSHQSPIKNVYTQESGSQQHNVDQIPEIRMPSSSRRFLYRSVKPVTDLNKPKIKHNKAKKTKVQVQNNVKISINSIKVRVVQTNTK
jgi:hypothetical protein